jgi:hypothetical protein
MKLVMPRPMPMAREFKDKRRGNEPDGRLGEKPAWTRTKRRQVVGFMAKVPANMGTAKRGRCLRTFS